MKLRALQGPTNKVQRPISLKIFGITLVLLVLMGVVSYSATTSMRRVNEQLGLLSDYYIPLDHLASQVRTHNLQQILTFERIQDDKPVVKPFDDINKAVAAHAAELGDCSDESQSAVSTKLREEFPERNARRLASYELQRQCGDIKIWQAKDLVEQALALSFVASDPVLVRKLTRLQTELNQVPQTRNGLHAIARRYLTDMRDGKDPRSLAMLQEQLDAQRRLFNRQARDISKLLSEDTKAVATTAFQLERRSFWFNWGVTSLAMLLGTICALLLTRNLMKPVRQLLRGTKAIEQGNLDIHLEVSSADEIALLTQSFNHMVNGLKEKEVIKETFGKYVDPRIVSSLIGSESTLTLEAAKRPMTVLFSDIEGFTAMCERLTPDRVVTLLNEYLSEMSQPIRESHGIIDKYIGDAIMAFWGPPFVGATQHATLACHSALDQQARLEGFRRRIPDLVGLRQGIASFNVRIGISTGEVTVGNIGSETAKSYTVIGDSTNLASRLESANKQFGTHVIISHDTWIMAQADIEVRELDAIRVVGKQEPVRVYELLARSGALDEAQRQLRDQFAEGLHAYRKQEWAAARAAFLACATLHAQDGPSQVFLKRLDYLERHPPGAGWDGVWNLAEK